MHQKTAAEGAVFILTVLVILHAPAVCPSVYSTVCELYVHVL
jgi:hypothetical protein